jgi:Kdo2-lipid IVA lauroyltransferase/acyltransferase
MLFFNLISRLPLTVLYFLSDLLYLLIFRIVKYRKKIVYSNLKNSFPDLSEPEIQKIQKTFYKHLCDLIFESLKLLTISEENLLKRVRIKNIDLPVSQISKGNTIIVACGHTGNWEWLLQASVLQTPYPADAVYKPLSSKFFDKLMLTIRSRFGASPLPMKEVPRSIVRKKDIARGIAMVADQTPPKAEIQYWNTFMHQDTAWFVGIEKIARMAELPVYYVGMNKISRGHYEIYFEEIALPPYDKNQPGNPIIEELSRKLEANIRNQPAYWLWSHRRWKHKKD